MLTDMAIRRVKVRLRSPADPDVLRNLPGLRLISVRNGTELVLEVDGDLDRLIKALAGMQVKDLETSSRSLEEIFLKYYQSDNQKEAGHVG